MLFGTKNLDTKQHIAIMGILNVTPDSFSDGGKYKDLDALLYAAETMIQDGADLLDIGGESTRPGHIRISEEEEIERVCPALEAIGQRFQIPCSLDTYKVKVAEAGIASGAAMINDIWGLRYGDSSMAELVAKTGVSVCLMHNREEAQYRDYLSDVVEDLQSSIAIAEDAGISSEKICIDPGIGFAKTREQNLILLNHLEILGKLNYPILLGVSRKSVIGNTLDLPVEEREEATVALTALGIQKGCSIIRVHDVKKNRRAADMIAAVLHAD